MARILIVEDNPANLALMDYLLRAFGHTPLIARDGGAGVTQALAERPDLILLDLHMPRVDGYEAARRIRLEPTLTGIPLIAVTASAMVGDRDRILAKGFNGYIAKPITPETFVEQVERFLRPPETDSR
jgi:CheY-like chemotaxis protein